MMFSELTSEEIPDWREEAERLNRAIHQLMGVETCETACTHRLTPQWTVLGVANVAARNGGR